MTSLSLLSYLTSRNFVNISVSSFFNLLDSINQKVPSGWEVVVGRTVHCSWYSTCLFIWYWSSGIIKTVSHLQSLLRVQSFRIRMSVLIPVHVFVISFTPDCSFLILFVSFSSTFFSTILSNHLWFTLETTSRVKLGEATLKLCQFTSYNGSNSAGNAVHKV